MTDRHRKTVRSLRERLVKDKEKRGGGGRQRLGKDKKVVKETYNKQCNNNIGKQKRQQ